MKKSEFGESVRHFIGEKDTFHYQLPKDKKLCKSCRKLKQLSDFIADGTEFDTCEACRIPTKICYGCGKKLVLSHFLENGIESKYCLSCRTKKNLFRLWEEINEISF